MVLTPPPSLSSSPFMASSIRQRLSRIFSGNNGPTLSPDEFEEIVESAANVEEVHEALAMLPKVHYGVELAWLARHGPHWDAKLLEICSELGPERLCALAQNEAVVGEAAEWLLNALVAPSEMKYGPRDTLSRTGPFFDVHANTASTVLMLLERKGQLPEDHPVLQVMWQKARVRGFSSLQILLDLFAMARLPLADVRKMVEEREGDIRLNALKYLVFKGEREDVVEYSTTFALSAPNTFANLLSSLDVERRGWIPRSCWQILLSSAGAEARLKVMRSLVPGGESVGDEREEGRIFSDAGERVPYFIREQEERLKGSGRGGR